MPVTSTVVTDQQLATYLGAPNVTPLISMVHQLAENHVKDFLGWREIVQTSWSEYYPQQQGISPVPDPHYIVDANHLRAVPGYYLSPNTIQLMQLPVRSITSIFEDPTGYFGQEAGAFGPGTQLVQGSDYFLKIDQPAPSGGSNADLDTQPISLSGHVVRRAFWFPATMGSVLVNYVSGFTANELAGRFSVFQTAVYETAADLYLRSMAIGLGQRPDLKSESDGAGVSAAYKDPRIGLAPVPDIVAAMLQPYLSYADLGL